MYQRKRAGKTACVGEIEPGRPWIPSLSGKPPYSEELWLKGGGFGRGRSLLGFSNRCVSLMSNRRVSLAHRS